jgi:flagellar hook-associated protein 3 FlgL
MNDLRAVVSGQPTPEDMIAAAQAWFDDPAGFDASIYTGSATSLSAFQLSETEEVSLDIRATDPAIKSLIMNSALAAIASDPAIALDVEGRTELYRKTGLALQSGQDTLTKLRARVGVAQERIEAIETRNESEKTSMQFALGALLQADPFEVATELESVQFQLQSLYAATVRSSQLSLVNFL